MRVLHRVISRLLLSSPSVSRCAPIYYAPVFIPGASGRNNSFQGIVMHFLHAPDLRRRNGYHRKRPSPDLYHVLYRVLWVKIVDVIVH